MTEYAVEIVPTCVPKDADAIRECVRAIKPFASEIHIDIDDGRFAPATTWPYAGSGEFSKPTLEMAEGVSSEIHLMVQDPRLIGIEFARAGALRILGHIEAFATDDDAHAALVAWREHGAREVGLGLLMQTPFERIDALVPACDVVHLMSIASIGTQGIPYEKDAPERIAAFHARHPDVLISVDGGVSETNIVDLVKAGARRFGVGAAISRASDPRAAYAELKRLAESAAV